MKPLLTFDRQVAECLVEVLGFAISADNEVATKHVGDITIEIVRLADVREPEFGIALRLGDVELNCFACRKQLLQAANTKETVDS